MKKQDMKINYILFNKIFKWYYKWQSLVEEKKLSESKFKNQLINIGLIKTEKIEKVNIKYLLTI